MTFRCDRCDNYETINKTAFCAHQDQCLMGGEAGESAEGIESQENEGDGDEGHSGHRSHRKMFECDVCRMKFSNGANMRRHKVIIKSLNKSQTNQIECKEKIMNSFFSIFQHCR